MVVVHAAVFGEREKHPKQLLSGAILYLQMQRLQKR